MYHEDIVKCLKRCPTDIFKFYHKFDYDINLFCVQPVDGNFDNFLLTNLELKRVGEDNKNPFVEVTKIFTFDSAHNLLNYQGPCQRLHGHTYHLEITIEKRIDSDSSMVMDFSVLKQIVKDNILDVLDHYNINEKIKVNPTAENMVVWMWEVLEKKALLKGLKAIKLYETPTSFAKISNYQILNSNYIHSYFKDLQLAGIKLNW